MNLLAPIKYPEVERTATVDGRRLKGIKIVYGDDGDEEKADPGDAPDDEADHEDPETEAAIAHDTESEEGEGAEYGEPVQEIAET